MRKLSFNDTDRRISQTTRVFVAGRLEDITILEWAIGLDSKRAAERTALREQFDYEPNPIREPFNLAWKCIFEYWERPDEEGDLARFEIKRQLKRGGSQRETIKLIIDAVRPWLKVDTSKRFRALSGEAPPSKPRQLKHVIYPSMTSASRMTPEDLALQENDDRHFLFELAVALNASLLAGLNIARMIGSIASDVDVTNWQVRRVYFVPPAQYPEGGGEPDRHSDGFAPATKLMFAVIERLTSVDPSAARTIINSWDLTAWTLYRRLWAAAARNPELVDADEVSLFLENLAGQEFWWAGSYPEMAEVRAIRWQTFSQESKVRLERRLLKGEPAKLIPKMVANEERQDYRDRHILVELQRIQSAGGTLSQKAAEWFEAAAARIENPPVAGLTQGFNQGVRLLHRVRSIDQSFGSIPTSKRLDELARSLADTGWDDKSQNASEYIADNALDVLRLLEKGADTATSAKVWQALGYSYRPSDLNTYEENASSEDLAKIPIALQICRAITSERVDLLAKAIEGLSSFMNSWERLLREQKLYHEAWIVLWPFAVEKTNADIDPDAPLNQEALNSPAGRLAMAVRVSLPEYRSGSRPLTKGLWPRMLRALAATHGTARLHAQFNLVPALAYFTAAAPKWSREFLLIPLQTALAEPNHIDIWEGFAMGGLPQKAITEELAPSLVQATLSDSLSGHVKSSLSELVVWSALHDRYENAKPAVPTALIQQMLRMGADDVRTSAVDAFSQYLKPGEGVDARKSVDIVKAVFNDVWPKELTLSSKAVSDKLADLPADAGEFYVELAELVLPYIAPFDCWSLYDFGVIDMNEPAYTIEIIDDAKKAAAFLAILDRSVGGEDGAVIPDGLEQALLHIKKIAPKLEKDARYQRLLTLSRR
ncbi:hypothetical protein ACSV5G_20675 [Agrobacterium cavarae]|uniref:hypothetical protein n=1 Tax=Agrobacterium cavarae TaxID=2528239 RepID=UPI003FD1C8FD